MPKEDRGEAGPTEGERYSDHAAQGKGKPPSPIPVGPPSPDPHQAEEDRRPTPVRAVMSDGEEEEEDCREMVRQLHDLKGGLDWIVTVSGHSSSGVLPLRTIPLMELSFAQVEEPGRPLRRALCTGVELSELSDEDLLSCFSRSLPVREPLQPPEGNKGSGRRGRTGRGS